MDSTLPTAVDVLIVGGGPAGLSAATWLGRYQRSVLVVDAGEQRNRSADLAHGLLGRDPVPPADLLADARAGLAQYPTVRLHEGTVQTVARNDDDHFRTVIDGTHEVTAARLILATGVRDRLPEVTGIEEHYGTDVHHCPACDGYSARGQEIIALGSGPHVPAFASELLDWADTVRIITDATESSFTDEQRATLDGHGIEVVDGVAEALIGGPGDLQGLRLADGRLVPGSKVFFSYAHESTNHLAAELGCELNDEGQVVVNSFYLSSIDGVYAAGDIVPGLQLVPIAIGHGAAAGIACATSLRGHDTTTDAPSPAPPTKRFTTD